MFEDETVDVACPGCGHKNSVLVKALEESAVQHIECESCRAHVRIDAGEFRHRLEDIESEVSNLEHEARSPKKRPRKSKPDWQI